MASESGKPTDRVERLFALRDRPYDHGFFATLRQLECLHPDAPRTGTSLRSRDDPVRFGQEPSLGFAPSTLSSFESDGENSHRLLVYFFGLFGPNGPLPLHLSEYARERLRNDRDSTFAGFADVFHHRLLSLFYRSWAAAQPAVNFDRPESDRFSLYVGALAGLGLPSLTGRESVPDEAKLHFAGHLSCHTRHVEGLVAFVQSFFGVPVRIEEFVGQWLPIPDDDQWRLGQDPDLGILGQTSTLGSRVWDCHQKFRMVVGQLDPEDFERFLPDRDTLRRFGEIVDGYAGPELAWDLRLVVRGSKVPPLRLGGAARLGWTSWLVGEAIDENTDLQDLMLKPR